MLLPFDLPAGVVVYRQRVALRVPYIPGLYVARRFAYPTVTGVVIVADIAIAFGDGLYFSIYLQSVLLMQKFKEHSLAG